MIRIGIIAVVALVSFSFYSVYGETFNHVIELPIPDNVTEQSKSCRLMSVSEIGLHYKCEFMFKFGSGGEDWYNELIEQFGLISSDSPIRNNDTSIRISDTPIPETFEKYQRDLERFTENPPLTGSDKEYHELLKRLAECDRGINESLGVFQKDKFAISETWINDDLAWLKSFDYKNRHQDLKRAIEECHAIHTKLNPVILGPQYANLAPFHNQTQTYHGEIAAKVPEWSQERVNQEANKDLDKPLTPKDIICNSDKVTKTFKIQSGCEFGIPVDCPNCVIKYDSEPYAKWQEYKARYSLP